MILALLGLAGVAGLAASAPVTLAAREVLVGPMAAQVLEVTDGDTLRVRVRIWLGQDLETAVRLHGLDTPELRGRCDEEKRRAQEARDRLAQLAGDQVVLREILSGKYAGRVVARVESRDGVDLAQALIEAGLGRAYDGGKRQGWCDAPGVASKG